jgi:BMFP domain-containing protein YqiC
MNKELKKQIKILSRNLQTTIREHQDRQLNNVEVFKRLDYDIVSFQLQLLNIKKIKGGE